MKETIIYISDSEKDVYSFLEYLERKLKCNKKQCSLDRKYGILKTENYDIVGKSVYGNRLGMGYGYCLYYCFSSNFNENKCNEIENEKLKEIIMHTRSDSKEVSELEVMYMLGLV